MGIKPMRYQTKIGTQLVFEGGSITLVGTTREHAEFILNLPPSVNLDRKPGENGRPDVIYLTIAGEAGSLSE